MKPLTEAEEKDLRALYPRVTAAALREAFPWVATDLEKEGHERGLAEGQARASLETHKEAKEVAPQSPVQHSVEPSGIILSAQTLEERLKIAWDQDPALRAEFGKDFAAFSAYMDAFSQGKVQILGGKIITA